MSNISRKLMGVTKNAPPSGPVEIVGATSTTLSQGSFLTSVSLEVGDFLLFINGNNGGFSVVSPPPLTSGYTDIITSGNTYRAFRLQYLVADTSGTKTVVSDDYGILIALRNVTSIGQFSTLSSSTTGTVSSVPNLSSLNTTNSLILTGSYFPGTNTSNDIVSVTSPFTLKTSISNSGTTLFSYAAIENNTNTSYTSKTLTTGSSLYQSTWAIELVGV